MQGRSRPEAYTVFLDRFVSLVVHKHKFRAAVRQASGSEEVCTASNEAIGLLLLENSWEPWMDIVTRTKHKQTYKKQRVGSDWQCKKPTMYTGRNPSKEERNIRQGDRGWTRSGVQRFNDLLAQVQADRQANSSFIRKYILDHHAAAQGSGRHRARIVAPPPLLLAQNELASRPQAARDRQEEKMRGQAANSDNRVDNDNASDGSASAHLDP